MDQIVIPWKATKDGLPAKPGKANYEHVYCLVITKAGRIKILAWNCEENCWDDEQGDDYACEPEGVTHYVILSELSTPQS